MATSDVQLGDRGAVNDTDHATDPPGSGDPSPAAALRLLRAVEPERDHLRGGSTDGGVIVVGYQDFLCPYCRRLRQVRA